MEHLIAKSGLGVAIAQVIQELHLHSDSESIKSMLLDIFVKKFESFKKQHSKKFPPCSLMAYYIVQNQYPVGENDVHQYFRCLAYDVKIGNGTLTIGSKEDKKPYTIIEGYSRNESNKKKTLSKAVKTSSSRGSDMIKNYDVCDPYLKTESGGQQSRKWNDYIKKKRKIMRC